MDFNYRVLFERVKFVLKLLNCKNKVLKFNFEVIFKFKFKFEQKYNRIISFTMYCYVLLHQQLHLLLYSYIIFRVIICLYISSHYLSL